MPPLPDARKGKPILISKNPVGFSYWPAEKSARYYKLKPLLFTTNPWSLIAQSIKTKCPQPARKAAAAFLQQAEDNFFAANSAGVIAAKPVLLYYSYMNLAKALILTRRLQTNCDDATHGVRERQRNTSGRITAAYLKTDAVGGTSVRLFSDFLRVFDGVGLAVVKNYDLSVLMPQVVPGHRMWTSASSKTERFLAIDRDKVALLFDEPTKTAWLSLSISREDISRLGITHRELITNSRLGADWKEVKGTVDSSKRPLVNLEMNTPVTYQDQPAEAITGLVAHLRKHLWSTVLSFPPYRRYYLYLAPQSEHNFILPEMLAIYALTFYLGSITRYRPHHFDAIADGPYGRFVHTCLSDHPTQFLYLMASEFAQQEITKPAIV